MKPVSVSGSLWNSNQSMTVVTWVHLTRDNPIFKNFLLEAEKASVSTQECRRHVCPLKHPVLKESCPRALVAAVLPLLSSSLVCASFR